VEKFGVENLKKCTNLTESLCHAFMAAKEDDGKITLSDLLDPDVWEHGFDAAQAVGDLAENWDLCMEEVKDLSSHEAMELVQHYFASFRKLYEELQGLKGESEG